MPGRSFSSNSYRYGFNGKEKQDELHGNSGDAYDFDARLLDVRSGRWLSPDPLEKKYPGISTYNFSYNNPIAFHDPNGKSGRLSVNYDSKTITFEQTVFLYGKEVKPGTAAALNKAYSSSGPSTRMVKDEDGKEWTVMIKITYVDVNAQVISKQLEGNNNKIPTVDDLKNTKEIVGYQNGDYILKIDRTVDLGSAGGFSGIGSTEGIVGKGGTDQAAMHEPFHGFGFVDAPGTGVFDANNNMVTTESQMTNGKNDIMQSIVQGVGTDIKNRHFTDLVDFVTSNKMGNVQGKVMNEQISKDRGHLDFGNELKINSRVSKVKSIKP